MSKANRTEADCLLEQGALYRTRVGLQRVEGDRELIFAGVKAGAFSVYSGDGPYFHFDLDGRWQRAFVAGIHYLKGLDTSVQAIDRIRENEGMVLDRRVVSYAEASDLDAFVRSFILELTADLDTGHVHRVEPPVGERVQPLGAELLHELLDRIAAWDAAAWFAQRERYLAAYGPIPLIPPDCQGAILLQATLGHAVGRAFGLARPGEFYARTVSEFTQHCHDVAQLLGRRAAECRMMLLLGADLFEQPPELVCEFLEIANRSLGTRANGSKAEADDEAPARPIHAIVDRFHAAVPSEGEWRRFYKLGLRRVTVELESGDPGVRALYRTDWQDADFVETVRLIKSAGLGVNVLTLVGAGGRVFGDEHVRRTSQLVLSLELGRGDFVFLLDERELTDPNLVPDGVTGLSLEEWNRQAERLKQELSILKTRGVKVLPYSLEKQRV